MSDTPELIKGVLVDGQIHKIDYNALANKPSIPEQPSVVTQLDELLTSGNNGKYVGITSSGYAAIDIKDPGYIIPSEYKMSDLTITTVKAPNCFLVGDYAYCDCSNLKNVDLANVLYIGAHAFERCQSLSGINSPMCIEIGSDAFAGCKNMYFDNYNWFNVRRINARAFQEAIITVFGSNFKSISFSACSYIGAFAFSSVSAYSLTMEFPECTYIGSGAFYDYHGSNMARGEHYYSFPRCNRVGSAAFANTIAPCDWPVCTTIDSYAFKDTMFVNHWMDYSMVTFPKLESIPYNAFENAILLGLSVPNCKYIGPNAFLAVHSVQTLEFGDISTINYGAFEDAEVNAIFFSNVGIISVEAFTRCGAHIIEVSGSCRHIGENAFSGCYNLESEYFNGVNEVRSCAFLDCSSLSQITFTKLSGNGEVYFSANAFKNCVKLTSLTLNTLKICKLGSTDVFESTPIGGYSGSAGVFGSVYVPSSLYSQYIVASYWSDIASRIVSM